MSVEKIAPLPPVTTDAQSLRVANRAPAPPAASAAAPSPTAGAPAEGMSHLFDSLVLPLPDIKTGEDRLLSAAVAKASYAQETSRPMIAELRDGRLTEESILREAETLLRNAAEDRGVPVRRLIESAYQIPLDRLPSENSPQSVYALKGRIPAYDANGGVRLFDLYLARIDAERWEATVFPHELAQGGPAFPYPTRTIDTYRLLIDPGAGLVLASVMEQMMPRPVVRPSDTPILSPTALRGMVIAAVLAAIALLLANLFSWRIAALFAAAAFGFLARVLFERKPRS
ncbi:hypothetical protein OGR47_03130 [Methylocystis sp. MJC1]|jgi:hypothetical protein|uniref:hypothetical protein n=1 Tax=Methylocystis sp. MJC1 TaxID=2654282 RepID=UPI0013EE336E|nr:hypothetical protein [Methylocystis sp. MJC1]KAF2991072.1 hypothetical protein MJC1_01804 [Methylocystis sp. MJC1]MBU6526007.1 hypothetical protein [Methylocystis sp. MJC1]UZX12474.1 hypothetical protein OGR47_03130 [Methylocystis sp. MJC1]